MANLDVIFVDEIRSIFCLKKREDLERIEEEEDCFILDFDPFEPAQLSQLSLNSPEDEDSDLVVVAEKGQVVACRDYPHPRHLCVKYPFEKTCHEKHCEKCYCVVCNKPAPCMQWNGTLQHCNATHRLDLDFKTANAAVIRPCN